MLIVRRGRHSGVAFLGCVYIVLTNRRWPMPVLIEVMTNDLVERHVSRGCQDGVDNHSPACVIIDCSASQSRKQELDMVR